MLKWSTARLLVKCFNQCFTAFMAQNEGLALRYAARSDVGVRREANEDSGYASARLLAVADGMGGHAGARSPARSPSPPWQRWTTVFRIPVSTSRPR
nr:hypothetical protein GCM10020093_096130 [Planobispora longispora]